MPRHRLTHALLLVAGLVLVTYVLISLYLPSSRWLVFGVDKHTGVVRVVQQSSRAHRVLSPDYLSDTRQRAFPFARRGGNPSAAPAGN